MLYNGKVYGSIDSQLLVQHKGGRDTRLCLPNWPKGVGGLAARRVQYKVECPTFCKTSLRLRGLFQLLPWTELESMEPERIPRMVVFVALSAFFVYRVVM